MSHGRLASDKIAFAGVIILLIIVVWGLVHAAGLASPWLLSFFSRSAPGITVSAPKDTTAGQPFSVTWKYSSATSGIYVFLYDCESGVQFETAAAGGGTIMVPCGAAFTVAGDGTITLTPHLHGSAPVQVPLTIAFVPAVSSSAPRVQGGANTTVHPASQTTESSASPAKETSVPAQKSTQNSNVVKTRTPADLSVRITSAYLDAANNVGVVSFDIANIGGTATGPWYFIAQLPTASGYLYTSPTQVSLSPGDHIVNTLRFQQPVSGVASIRVDPAGLVAESDTANNYASVALTPQLVQSYPYIR